MAYHGIYYAAPISIPACFTSNQALNSGTKGLFENTEILLTVDLKSVYGLQ
jgi:hypothetical protein